MSANPIDLVGGLTNTSDVVKADLIAWAKARVPQVMEDATEVSNTSLAGQLIIMINDLGTFYYLDPTDSTSPNDPPEVIVSLDNKRFKPLSSVPAPTTGSLGGVFASAAVSTEYVTGLDNDGNLLRAQPSAADLSDGVEGTGAVVLKSYADALVASQDAMVFKDIIDCSANPNYPAADRGWTYRVSVSGKIGGASGANVEAGDILLCLTDGTVSGNQATVGTSWGVIQVNIDGAVTLTGTQTLTNKTLTAPVINSPTGIVKGDVGLGNVDNTSNTTERAATATLTNKTFNTANNTFTLNGAAFGTAAQATAALNAMVGDSGSGGTKGLVPAPGAGDAAGGKFLKADGTYAVPPGSGGGGSLPDDVRQNLLLTTAYQSKSFAAFRRLVLMLATGFKGASDALNGILTASSSNYLVNSTAGYVAPTTAAGSAITGGTNIGDMVNRGTLTAAFDGNTNQAYLSSASKDALSTTAYVGKNITSKAVGVAIVYGSNNNGYVDSANPTVTLNLRGKATSPANAADGTLLGTVSFTDTANESGNPRTITSTDIITTWNYIWVELTHNGSAASLSIAELQLYEPGTPNNMSLVTTPQTVDSTVSNGRVLLEYDNSATPAINTDLTVEVSCKIETATVTISNASPGVITHASHGMSANDPVVFTTSGALPTGLVSGTTYFVVASGLTSGAYSVSATPGGSAINTSSAGSGTHTATYRNWTAASLSSVTANGQDGHKIVETADQACTSGTSFAARVKTFNNKNVLIYAMTVTVH